MVESALAEHDQSRQAHWSDSIAVGSERFADEVKEKLGISAKHRNVTEARGSYTLREPLHAYTAHFDSENVPLRAENGVYWDVNSGASDAWRGPTRKVKKSNIPRVIVSP